jgi:hypothetical protein
MAPTPLPPTSVATGRAVAIAAALGVAGLAVGVTAAAAGALPGALLMSFVFVAGLSLGGLALLLIDHMAGGSWGAVARRPLEAMAGALPVALLFFVPVAFFMGDLYPWMDPVYVANHKLVAWKADYLAQGAFLLRTLLYAAIWLLTAAVYLRGARAQDAADVPTAGRIGYRLKSTAALWLVGFVLAMTLATTDWTMSLTPEWWSGIYGVIFMIGQAITAMALTILTLVTLARVNRRVDGLLTEKRLQDLGNFLMAFTMFWAYVNASQLIIQWTNNIVETNTFYVLRLYQQPWTGLGSYLIVAGFFLPFLILFSRWVKRRRAALSFMAGWSLLNQALFSYWLIAPEVGRTGLPALSDVALFLGVLGIWFAGYLWNLGRASTIPERDPRLLAAMHVEHHAAAGKQEVRHA